MTLSHHIMPSFAGGELAPSLHARVDLAKYHTGLKTARNVNILPQGGVRNRPGTYHVSAAKDSTHKVRLMPFVYSDGQAYILEFGEYYLRVYKNGALLSNIVGAPTTIANWIGSSHAYVVGDWVMGNSGAGVFAYQCLIAHNSGTFLTDVANGKWLKYDSLDFITTLYTGAQLFDIKVTQSADYLFLFHPSHAPQQLVRVAETSWQITPFPFKNGPFMLSNISPSKTLASDTLMTTYSVSLTINAVEARYIIGANNSVALRFAAPHGLTAGRKVKISALDGALAAKLNGNIYNVRPNPDYPTTVLDLMYEGTTDLVFVPAYADYYPGAGVAEAMSTATITANFPCFDALHVGSLWQMIETIPAQSVSKALTSTVASTAIKCGNTWRIITSGGWTGTLVVYASTDGGTTYLPLRTLSSGGNDNYDTSGDTGTSQCLVRVIVTTSAGACTINLYGDTFDWVTVVKIDSVSTDILAEAIIQYDNGIGAGFASTNATSQWAEGSWSDYRGWPTVATFYQDRLVAASTISEPQTRWFSQTADYVNFGISAPIVDSDAISDLLSSRTVNIVNNMIALTGLVTLTSDSDFSTEPGNSGILSPSSIFTQCQGHRGSSDISPAVVGNELILALPMGSSIRNLIYQFSVQGYMGDNISVVSQHLFTGYTIIEMAYQQEPDSLVWAVRSDGVLLCLTYLREQEVIAWTHCDTDGLFESVAVIPNTTLGINEVWFVVNRGGTRFIERLAKRDMGTNVKNYVMLDCATTTTSSGTTVSGLTYLNGKVVNVLADGDVVEGLTVAAGAITLPRAATIVHVGLPYVSDVETLRIEQADQKGTSQGRRVVIPEVTIRFMDSRGGWIKPMAQDISAPAATGVSGFDEVLERDAADLASAPLQLQTKDFKISLDGGYDLGGRLFFRQTQPLPFTLLAFVPKVEISDN